jgi:hypothetical protein
MISSDRRARMMLSWAMDAGDLAVAELVQLGSEDWTKIIEGALGEPAAERAIRIKIDVVERGAKAEGAAIHCSWRRRVADRA